MHLRLALALLLLCAPAARAAGFYYPGLGATPLGRGATGAAGAGDLSALAYNPAGLLELTGLRVQADVTLSNQSVTFTRQGSCGAPPGSPCADVNNGAGGFFNAVGGVSYRMGNLALALGAYGPPSIGRYQYPNPRTVQGNPAVQAPQRYSLIDSDNFILYPSLGAAYRVASWLDLGAVVAVRTFHVHQTQSLFVLGNIGGDVPEADAIATFDARDTARLAVGAGLVVRPLAGLSLGLSARPSVPVHATGTLDVDAPLASVAGVRVEGRSAKVDLTLPAEARLGLRYERGRWAGLFDVGWEGWGVLREMVVTPLDVVLKTGQGATEEATKVAPIHLAKHFHAAWSFRAGGEVDLPDAIVPSLISAIRFRLGALYETSAIPDETLQVDFPNTDRIGGTLGLTARIQQVSITLGYAHYFSSTRTVTDSIVTRVDPYPAPPFVIGNGSYQGSLDVFAAQAAFTFGP
jgi:long-chain fatty acid transport protein